MADGFKIFEERATLRNWTYVGKDGVLATKTIKSTCGGTCDQEVSPFTSREEGSE
jgi:hypothetical protein